MAVTINASTSAGLVQTADTSGVLQLQTNSGTTAVTIDTSQNVGIGTTSPATALSFPIGTNKFIGQTFVTPHISGNVGSIGLGINDGGNQTGVFVYNTHNGTYSSQDIRFLTAQGGISSATERMRIDSSGACQWNGTYSAGSDRMQYSSGQVLQISKAGTGSNNHVQFVNGNGTVGTISTSGTSTTYSTSSDYRLKENVEPMTGALDTVAQLKPVTYKWKIDGSYGQGFIAHELQEVVPDCVSGEKDAVDAEGNIKPQGIDTSFLVATLTAAIQEQQTIINDLKARITALEGASL